MQPLEWGQPEKEGNDISVIKNKFFVWITDLRGQPHIYLRLSRTSRVPVGLPSLVWELRCTQLHKHWRRWHSQLWDLDHRPIWPLLLLYRYMALALRCWLRLGIGLGVGQLTVHYPTLKGGLLVSKKLCAAPYSCMSYPEENLNSLQKGCKKERRTRIACIDQLPHTTINQLREESSTIMHRIPFHRVLQYGSEQDVHKSPIRAHAESGFVDWIVHPSIQRICR